MSFFGGSFCWLGLFASLKTDRLDLSGCKGCRRVSVNFALLVGYFGFLLGALILHTRPVANPWLFLLRSFFPNWRFFHALGRAPRLYYRFRSGDDWSDWHRFMPRAQRKLYHLFYNAEVNLALSEQNLVDHLANDLADCADDAAALGLVTYRMVERLVRTKLDAVVDLSAYQFRLCLERPGQEPSPGSELFEADTILLSPVTSIARGD